MSQCIPASAGIGHRCLRYLLTLLIAATTSLWAASVVFVTPSVNNGNYVNGVAFKVSVSTDIDRVSLEADGYPFLTLNAANGWGASYTFTNLGSRNIVAKALNAGGTQLTSTSIRINVVDQLFYAPANGSSYTNGSEVRIAASPRIKEVRLFADIYQIGSSTVRNANNLFAITPPLLNTLGTRNFVSKGYDGNGNLLDTRTITVTVVSPPVTQTEPPLAPREFRAMWVATVSNIDWPSNKNLTVAQQQAELISMLDKAKAANMNAVILQVRPAADAIYPSTLEPWSEYLTGQQGVAPSPSWDPLQMWITEAHKRGIELHAWFNPYRAKAKGAGALAGSHIYYSNPEVVKSYDGMLWMDPAETVAANRTIAVISDVLTRYDIDGVHIDDYFYPYPVYDGSGNKVDFPDSPAWNRYLTAGGSLSKADWRRKSVNDMVYRMYNTVRQYKPLARFGIAPFGIGKPSLRPAGIVGFSQYDEIYADAELWLNNGWLDYFSPQLYWKINQTGQQFDILQTYWRGQNWQNRHIWPGMWTTKIDGTSNSWPVSEIINQINLTRQGTSAAGHVHFSAVGITQNRKAPADTRGLADELKASTYTAPALIPHAGWLDNSPTPDPVASASRNASAKTVTLTLTAGAGKATRQFAVWALFGSSWRFTVVQASSPTLTLADDATLGAASQFYVTAVDRVGKESNRIKVIVP
ncbi:glycoside hydrolase family 10 protein [Chitinimonas sp. BJYL2]|uniref:glycoside hydrolase family 10 protein n=1 Tax=Chitinimonas sp. BJYL2 TaxID=2976696 RepID=UPI0022B4CBC2|nr:family 10 glycosylhydrolase [Chitinimonas sp. BJYL2]